MTTATQSNSCINAPGFAVRVFDDPVQRWAVIECTNDGHFVSPAKGYKWLAPSGREYNFSAFGPVRPSSGLTPDAFFFVKQGHRKLEGKHVTNVNKMLKIAGSVDTDYREIYQLDVLTNLVLRYNIFFFVKEGSPEHILGCINDCSESVHLKVIKNLQ